MLQEERANRLSARVSSSKRFERQGPISLLVWVGRNSSKTCFLFFSCPDVPSCLLCSCSTAQQLRTALLKLGPLSISFLRSPWGASLHRDRIRSLRVTWELA